MSTVRKAAASLALLVATSAAVSALPVRADTTVIEERQTTITPAPSRIIEKSVMIAPAGALRSDYDKRLDDMRDQIELGLHKGWLSAGQASYLEDWQADVKREVADFRSAGGGIVPRDTVNQLERHVNSLAWLINREIGEGSRRLGLP